MGTQDREPTDRELKNLNTPSEEELRAAADREDLESLDRRAERRATRDVHDWDTEDVELRDIAAEIEVIGPEDEDPAVKEENLEEYGFDLMDDDEKLSVPSATPTPGWDLESTIDEPDSEDELREMANDSEGFRPVEDEAIADLDDDLPPERESPEL